MYYTEEELLEAIDILVEEYDFYEDEAIDMICEAYFNSILLYESEEKNYKDFDEKEREQIKDAIRYKKYKNIDYKLEKIDDEEKRMDEMDRFLKEKTGEGSNPYLNMMIKGDNKRERKKLNMIKNLTSKQVYDAQGEIDKEDNKFKRRREEKYADKRANRIRIDNITAGIQHRSDRVNEENNKKLKKAGPLLLDMPEEVKEEMKRKREEQQRRQEEEQQRRQEEQQQRRQEEEQRRQEEEQRRQEEQRKQEEERKQEEKERIRKRNGRIAGAVVVGGGLAASGYIAHKAYKNHKAKKEAEARRNRGLRGKSRRLREDEELMIEELQKSYGIFENEYGELFIESEMVDYLMDEYDLYEEDAIDLIMESFEEELTEISEAIEILVEEYGYDEYEAIDLILETFIIDDCDDIEPVSEGFVGDYAKRKARESVNNAIENKKNEFKQGLEDRKKAVTDTVNYGMNKRRNEEEFRQMKNNPSNSTPRDFMDKKYEYSKNVAGHANASKAMRDYAYKDRKIIGGAAAVGAGLLAHRQLKKRQLRKQVRKIMDKEAARRY